MQVGLTLVVDDERLEQLAWVLLVLVLARDVWVGEVLAEHATAGEVGAVEPCCLLLAVLAEAVDDGAIQGSASRSVLSRQCRPGHT